MVSSLTIAPHTSAEKPRMDQIWGVSRPGLDLTKDRLSDVFRVFDGPVVLLSAFMEITTAASANVCNMSWVFDSDAGGDRIIGDAVSITSAALGDFIWAELDGTALVKATTATGLIHGGYYRGSATGYGTILTAGGIDIIMGSNALTTGTGTLHMTYEPLVARACLVAEDMVLS